MTCGWDEAGCLDFAGELTYLLGSHPVLLCDQCTCSVADAILGDAPVFPLEPRRPGKDLQRMRSEYGGAAEMVRCDAISVVRPSAPKPSTTRSA